MKRHALTDEIRRKPARKPRQADPRQGDPQRHPPGLRDEPARLNRLVGNRAASRLMSGGQAQLQRQPAGGAALPTPAELAEKELSGGPGRSAKEWQRTNQLLKKTAPGQRVTVDTPFNYGGVKLKDGDEFQKEFQKASSAGKARSEARLPEAFLAVESGISPTIADHLSNRTMKTNVVLDARKTKGGGQVWVTEVNLSWTVKTAAFLDISRIDPKMLSPVRKHEEGHRVIAENILSNLAKRLKAELEQDLPSEQKPLNKTGKDWFEAGLNDILRQIDRVTNRYLSWWEDLTGQADSAWDAQEVKTLTSIAAARIQRHQPAAPVMQDED